MSYCHITRFDLMHVMETGPALRHLGQSFPFQQTISTQATSYLCAVRHATQRSAPGANTRAPTLPPHVITDWEYGRIEYGGLPVARFWGSVHGWAGRDRRLLPADLLTRLEGLAPPGMTSRTYDLEAARHEIAAPPAEWLRRQLVAEP